MTKTQVRKAFARECAERLARKTGQTVFVHENTTPPLYQWWAAKDPARPEGGLVVAIVEPPEGHGLTAEPVAEENPLSPKAQWKRYRETPCACCGATGTSAGSPPKCEGCTRCNPDRDIKGRTCPMGAEALTPVTPAEAAPPMTDRMKDALQKLRDAVKRCDGHRYHSADHIGERVATLKALKARGLLDGPTTDTIHKPAQHWEYWLED